MATSLATSLDGLDEKPAHLAGCCSGVSKSLLCALADRLPPSPALILSIGSGSGLFEALLLQASAKQHSQAVNLYGVDVPPCVNNYLPDERLLRVPCTKSLHPDALLASALIFVYPRDLSLITMYLNVFLDGALEKVIWLSHRDDWRNTEELLLKAFFSIEVLDIPGIPEYELLAIATMPRYGRNKGG